MFMMDPPPKMVIRMYMSFVMTEQASAHTINTFKWAGSTTFIAYSNADQYLSGMTAFGSSRKVLMKLKM